MSRQAAQRGHRRIFRSRPVLRPLLEPLESRRLLATSVSWTSASSGSWDTASNWSPAIVPGTGDDVTINVPGVTVTISSKVESVNSITADDPLVISGGGLTVAASSTISDGLNMTGGSLTANGSGITLTVAGATTDTGGNLYAEDGATLSLTQLAAFIGGTGYADTLEATGAGSVLSLPDLTSITENTSFYSLTTVQALAGGDVQSPALAQLSGGPFQLESDGTGSQLNVSALTSVQAQNTITDKSSLQVTNHGTVLDGSLTSLNNTNLTLDGTGTIATSQITTYTSGTLSLTAGTVNLSGLTDIDGSAFEVSGAVTVTLPAVTSATGTSFEASGERLAHSARPDHL